MILDGETKQEISVEQTTSTENKNLPPAILLKLTKEGFPIEETPIPTGTIRAFHYTHSPEQLDSILKEGIDIKYSLGTKYEDINPALRNEDHSALYVSTIRPRNNDTPYVEVFIKPEEVSKHNYIYDSDVTAPFASKEWIRQIEGTGGRPIQGKSDVGIGRDIELTGDVKNHLPANRIVAFYNPAQ